jgi:hypothetical protein
MPPAIDPNSDYAKESKLARILAPLIVFHLIALSFVGMRSYVRLHMMDTFGKDDMIIIAGAVSGGGGGRRPTTIKPRGVRAR